MSTHFKFNDNNNCDVTAGYIAANMDKTPVIQVPYVEPSLHQGQPPYAVVQPYASVVPAPLDDSSTVLVLLCVGFCCPFVWYINACIHWGSNNPITRKYAKVSLLLGLFETVCMTLFILFGQSLSFHKERYN